MTLSTNWGELLAIINLTSLIMIFSEVTLYLLILTPFSTQSYLVYLQIFNFIISPGQNISFDFEWVLNDKFNSWLDQVKIFSVFIANYIEYILYLPNGGLQAAGM